MQEYANKEALTAEIQRTAALFIKEFDGVAESDKNFRLDGVDRTPQEILAYQLGWMDLLRGWDRDEQAGKTVATPAPGYKWNQMGTLYQGFYDRYREEPLAQLVRQYTDAVADLVLWVNTFSDGELFQPGGRKWAQSTPL